MQTNPSMSMSPVSGMRIPLGANAAVGSVSSVDSFRSSGVCASSIAVTPMRPRICICCAEPMTEDKHALSGNPNVCNSCLSLLEEPELGMPRSEKDYDGMPTNSVVTLQESLNADSVMIQTEFTAEQTKP
jgi:hypothetical protein